MRQNKRSTAGLSKIGDLVPQLMVRFGLHRRRNVEQIEEAWRQAVGNPFDAVTQVTEFSRGTLSVSVPHNGFIQELSFRQSELLETLGSLIQGEKIKKIRYHVGDFNRSLPGAESSVTKDVVETKRKP